MDIAALDLSKVPTFKGLGEKEKQWFLGRAGLKSLDAGEKLFTAGDKAEEMFLVFSGKIDLYQEIEAIRKHIGTIMPGHITGLLPYSRMQETVGEGIAAEPSIILSLHRKYFSEMEEVSQELVKRLVAVMTNRVRDFTRAEEQQEKLSSLGKLAAGLAHELNNPAAAIKRTASELVKRIDAQLLQLKELAAIGLKPEHFDKLSLTVKTREERKTDLSMMERSDMEDELAAWLEGRKVGNGMQLADTLLDSGFLVKDLEELENMLPANSFPAVIAWLENNLASAKLTREIEEASGRISELVDSVKGYSHMDHSAEMVPTDIHSGINSTIVMLGYKIKKKNIKLEKKYGRDLPLIRGYASELNQVWTNLLDNAIDAVEDGGRISVVSMVEGEHVKVVVGDNGHGVPAGILSKIFDPFFTTRDVGQGTGLGLDIVRRIIANHHGDIRVESVPGKTEFILSFPTNMLTSGA
jgi:signal transduction histidine kinase